MPTLSPRPTSPRRRRSKALEAALRDGAPEDEMIAMITDLADAMADLAAVIGT